MNNVVSNPREEFRKRNLEEWKSFLLKFFQNNIPQSKTWRTKTEIISVLNMIGAEPNLNHLFLPTGGGLDVTGAKVSYEDNCIELLFGKLAYIVKPAYLSFESFGEEYEWAYFRLETLELAPSGIYTETPLDCEELIEISPKKYAERYIWDQGFLEYDESGDEIPLPKSARVISRMFSGAYSIFAKGSIYNATPDSYDALHNKLSESEFRKHIEEAIEYLKNN